MPGQDVSSAGWRARFQAVRSNAAYNHGFGIETWWRANFETAGYPLTDNEESFSYGGKDYNGRVFSGAGVVIWNGSKAVVLGWL